MNRNRISNKRAGAVSVNLMLIIAGILLFALGRFVMTGDAYKPNILEGIDLHLGETVTSIGVFLFLIGLISGIFVKPLAEAINNRTSELEKTFSEAEDLAKKMEATKVEYEARLAETEASAREQIQGEIKKAQDLRKQLEADAAANADALLKKAQAEIAAERDRALVDLRVHVATLSLLATERILEENMDNERNRKLIDDFIDQVEVPNA